VTPETPFSPSNEIRRQSPKQRRLQSWWVRLFLVLLSGVLGWQIWKLVVTGHQLNPWHFNQLGHETVHWSWRGPTCPLEYKRHQWVDIQAGRKRPYLFGGQQEPECTNCDVDALWSHFCQFKSHVSYPALLHCACQLQSSLWLAVRAFLKMTNLTRTTTAHQMIRPVSKSMSSVLDLCLSLAWSERSSILLPGQALVFSHHLLPNVW